MTEGQNHFWARAAVAALLCGGSAAQATGPAPAQTREQAFASLANLPDWDGVWETERSKDPEPKLTLAAATAKADFEASKERGENLQGPAANCVPDGMPRIMRIYPIEFIFSPGRVTIGIETYSQTRRVFTDGRPLPDDPDPFFNGSSVGHWEGDTLVIDTIGLNNQNSLVSGVHLTDQTRIQERIRLEGPDLLVDTFAITDPNLVTEPHVYRQSYRRHRDWEIREYVCQENNHDAADALGRPSLSLDP
ncbi:MAG: hypothetical protein ABIT16_00880 [Croceibacterium sp.]